MKMLTASRLRPRRRGMVLLMVVVIVMLLSLAAYKFMLSMQTEHMAVALNGDRIMAEQAACSARDLLAYMLEQPRSIRDEWGGLQDNPDYFAGDPTVLMRDAPSTHQPDTARQTAFGIIAYALPETDADAVDPFGSLPGGVTTAAALADPSTQAGEPRLTELAGRPIRFGARNESAKLNLLKLLQWESRNPGAGRDALMLLPGMDEDTADAILDWIDADDDPRPNGAESDFYATLTRPLSPRNALVSDLDELLFVRGVTALRLYGTETEMPPEQAFESTQPAGVPVTSETARLALPWCDYLTVYSAERNESYTGQPRVFLNAENLRELYDALLNLMPQAWADFIVLYRQFGAGQADSSASQNGTAESTTIDFTLKPEFMIRSLIDLVGVTVTVPDRDGSGDPTVIASPIQVSGMQAEFAEIFDLITVVPESRMVGRVNINEAPAEVLASLPGMNTEAIEAILASRETAGSVSRTHPIWLLVEGIVDREMMKKLLPHITCGGDVYRAEVWGREGHRSAAIRFETILDSSGGDCRPVYYRELSVANSEIPFPSPSPTPALDGQGTTAEQAGAANAR